MPAADVLFLARLGEIRESQQRRGDEQADAHNKQTRAEHRLHLVLEEEAHNHDGDHRDQDVDDVFCALVPLELEEVLEEPHDLFPEDETGAQHRGDMYDDGKVQCVLTVDTKQVLADGQMAAAADGEVLRQALNDT